MMDAVEIIREYARMCLMMSGSDCEICGLSSEKNGTNKTCNVFMQENPEKAVEIIEKQAAEHPVKTRQSEFLKMFPNAKVDKDKIPRLYPCDMDTRISFKDEMCKASEGDCYMCRRYYWLAEVE